MLALLLAPLAMAGGESAHASGYDRSPPAAADGHCADVERESRGEPGPSIDCMIACTAIPAAGNALAGPDPTRTCRERPSLAAARDGLAPEAATPPPRFV